MHYHYWWRLTLGVSMSKSIFTLTHNALLHTLLFSISTKHFVVLFHKAWVTHWRIWTLCRLLTEPEYFDEIKVNPVKLEPFHQKKKNTWIFRSFSLLVQGPRRLRGKAAQPFSAWRQQTMHPCTGIWVRRLTAWRSGNPPPLPSWTCEDTVVPQGEAHTPFNSGRDEAPFDSGVPYHTLPVLGCEIAPYILK